MHSRFLNYLTTCAGLITQNHPLGSKISTQVTRFDELDDDSKRYLLLNDNLTDPESDQECRDELLKITLANVAKPSLWLVVGNAYAPQNPNRAMTECTKEIKLLPEFETGVAVFPVPCNDPIKNNAANADLSNIWKRSVSGLYRALDSQTRLEGPLDTTPDPGFFDCNSDLQLVSERSEVYIRTQHEKISQREKKLAEIAQNVKGNLSGTIDNDLFEVHAMSGRDYSRLDLLSAQDWGFLDWDTLTSVLTNEFSEISHQVEFRRLNPRSRQGLTEDQETELNKIVDEKIPYFKPLDIRGGTPVPSLYDGCEEF
ncbi:hypothetical protein I302_100930 [Kwoniella bestiolae CBS 10118]|uniref:Uncharacterized protein n=1 Tax=Kwoniella bestiolae CBS 10118 TaxID=1296100 RepID=A0A1B9G6I3_9TREE|nr:hypothetical protein I302_04306 [Kwoniella bestiolae CBS 10118]OCF26620.1 hypothetical protein I302_04306 [Kwoniella bestiolae CBS 10118]